MALSKDEKKEILELRGRLYSHRKIADRTSRSENTVRKVIKEASEQVIVLASKDLAADKIAERLDFPLTFVDEVVAEWQTEPKKPLVASNQLEETAIGREWEGFKRGQQLERAKGKLRKQIEAIVSDLAQLDAQTRAEGILDDVWKDQRKSLDEQAGFALQKIEEIDSVESLFDLQNVVSKVAEASALLCND